MAMMASNGPEEEVEAPLGSREREVRSVVEEPRRSPAPREEVVVLWIWEAEKSLLQYYQQKVFVFANWIGEAGGGGGEQGSERNVLGARNRQFPRPGYGLHDDVRFLDTGCQ